MAQGVSCPTNSPAADFIVPGTCVCLSSAAVTQGDARQGKAPRDPLLRRLYLSAALADVPRLLGAIDRNPYRSTYGCLDRQYWHYRTAGFPSQMYQEGVLPLALVVTTKLPGNRWHGDARVRELAIAAMRFSAKSEHRDGSCDDYYPYERALGAAVFSLQAAARAYEVLELDDAGLRRWFERRGQWLMRRDESGRLANHQALAALGLLRVGRITGKQEYCDAARQRITRVLGWQSDEGWFEEYGGADPGYQTVTIDCLAKIRGLTSDAALDEPLRRAVAFARCFLHPDGSYAGEYGSRGTYHFYPHGMELLAGENPEAADLADGFLRGLAAGKQAALSDDRMFAHRLGNLIEAYIAWAADRPLSCSDRANPPTRYFPEAGILVRRQGASQTVISAARGGVFKHFCRRRGAVTDAGLIIETGDGRVAVSQIHDRSRPVEVSAGGDDDVRWDSGPPHTRRRDEGAAAGSPGASLSVIGPLHWSRFETATPLRQALFHAAMVWAGRWSRTLVRRLLQRRLITGRRRCPVRLRRTFEFLPQPKTLDAPELRITDVIELTDRRVRVRRMSFGTDHLTAYVAAGNVYQDAVLAPWIDLEPYIGELNSKRRVTVVREL